MARGRLDQPRVASVVLTNAVRYADRSDAPAVDVLDAVRRLVPLDVRHVDRANAEGFLKTGKEMADVADEICRLAGLRRARGRAAARPAPGSSPTGARSTRVPTSASARCTSPSSRSAVAPVELVDRVSTSSIAEAG